MYDRRSFLILSVAALAVTAGLWAAQGANHRDMNGWSYSQVRQMMSQPQTAKKVMMLAKKNHVMLMGGRSMGGHAVALEGELTGADCYLSTGDHGHGHALCAKACVSHGGPIVFLGNNGTAYLVLPPKDGAHYPAQVLNDLGKAGITVKADEIDFHGIKALAVQAVEG